MNFDLPISNVKEDLLNRKTFVEDLSKVIVDQDFKSSFCIGLYGPWGSGKTSIVNLLFSRIKAKDENVILFRFNPWVCSDPTELVSQFLQQFATVTAPKFTKNSNLLKNIEKYANAFTLAKFIPIAGTYIESAADVAKDALKNAVEYKTDIQVIKNEISKEIENKKCKIVISIDDIDRLSDKEIIAVFQLVKSLADFPNTVYLLSFDVNVVMSALKGVQSGAGASYLEKIIQLPIEIPWPRQEALNDYFLNQLREIVGDELESKDADSDEWGLLLTFGIYPYLKTIRDINRFCNVFSVKYNLLKDKVYLVDLIGITALQVFEPLFYTEIYKFKDLIFDTTGKWYLQAAGKQADIRKEEIKELVKGNTKIRDIEATQSILSILFPQIAHMINPFFGARTFIGAVEQTNNRISIISCFDRYFSLTITSDEITYSELYRLLISMEADLDTCIKAYRETDRYRQLLSQINTFLHTSKAQLIDEKRAKELIFALSEVGGFTDRDNTNRLGKPHLARLYTNIVCQLFRRMEQKAIEECLIALCQSDAISIATQSMVVSCFVRLFNHQFEGLTDTIITEPTYKTIVSMFAKRAKDNIVNGEFLDDYEGLYFFGVYHSLRPDEAKEAIESQLNKPKAIAKFISHFATRTYTMSNVLWSFDEEALEVYLKVSEAKDIIRGFIETKDFKEMSEYDQMNIVAFNMYDKNIHFETPLSNDSGLTKNMIEERLSSVIQS